jgi:hypothetical protein
VTATLPPHADVRDCRLYRFRVYHPDDMHLDPSQRRIVLGYIGETVRQPLARLLEHLADQPWWDTVVGWDLDPRVFAGKQAVCEAERAAIEWELPLYNVEWNRGNGRRIPPPLAIRQRRARDAAKEGAPRWVHPADRGVAPRRAAAVVAERPQKPWRPWQKRLAGWGSGWVGTALAGWIAELYYHLGGWKQTGITAATGSLLLMVWLMCGAPFPVGKWKRRARNLRRRLWR